MTNGVALVTPQERLHQRLNDPHTAEIMLQILDKLDVIALTVDSIDGFLRRGDEIMDNVSEGVHELRAAVPANKLDMQKTATALSESLPPLVEALPQLTHTLPRLLELTRRLDDPNTAEALDQILNKIELVAFTLNSLDGFLQRSDTVIDSVANGIQEMRMVVPVEKLDVPHMAGVLSDSLPPLVDALPQITQSLPRLLELTRRLDDPDTSEALDKLLDNIGLAAFMLTSLDGFLQRSDTVIDSLAEGVHEIRGLAPANETKLLENVGQALPQLAAMLPQLVNMMPQITAMLPAMADVATRLETILTSKEFDALMNSGVFAPRTVGIVGQAGDALVDSYEASQVNPKPLGPIGLFRALSDPDIQRALGFLVDFGKRFGQAMDEQKN